MQNYFSENFVFKYVLKVEKNICVNNYNDDQRLTFIRIEATERKMLFFYRIFDD